jgi:hypothetical protein
MEIIISAFVVIVWGKDVCDGQDSVRLASQSWYSDPRRPGSPTVHLSRYIFCDLEDIDVLPRLHLDPWMTGESWQVIIQLIGLMTACFVISASPHAMIAFSSVAYATRESGGFVTAVLTGENAVLIDSFLSVASLNPNKRAQQLLRAVPELPLVFQSPTSPMMFYRSLQNATSVLLKFRLLRPDITVRHATTGTMMSAQTAT